MVTLYGIPNCDTVKKARVYLEKHSIKHDFVDFKKTPPSTEEILFWADFFGELPVNKKGQTYRKHAAAYEKLSDRAKLEFICENPSIIKRPILQKNKKVLSFGFDEDVYKKVLGK